MTGRVSFLVGTFLALVILLPPPANAQIIDHANLVWNGPATCLPCHETQARAMHGAAHYQWQGPTPYMTSGPMLQGKISSSLNSYCINILGNWVTCSNCHVGLGQPPLPEATPAQLENIDCLVCHQASYKRVKINGVFVPDLQNMTITMDEAARTVHMPVRLNCVQCHGKGGGGDNYKRGDITVAHGATADRNFDVHMATTGADLACQACHTVSNHRIAGRGSDLRSTDLDVPVTCSTSQCHPNKTSATGHQTQEVNRHVARVACQTCHIPAYARNAADTPATEATEIYRTWLEPHQIPTGAFHPLSVLANDLKPVYRFWNKYNTNYNLYEQVSIDPLTGRYPTSRPVGKINDRTTASKLYPFKYKTALQPLVSSRGQLIALDTSVYFSSGNVQAAVSAGLANMGYSPQDPYEFVETDTFQLITHEVPPVAQVLTCSSCHGTTNQMNLGALGYGLKNSTAIVCSQCHSLDKANEPLTFRQLHNLHVTEKRYDCGWCHSFSRPERQLALSPGPAGETDFNGDGKPDLIWRNPQMGRTTIWYLDGVTWTGGYADVLPEGIGSEWEIAGVADFNHDGKADFLWRNAATGRTTIWYMEGANWTGGYADVVPTITDASWSIVGVADFNGDDNADLLWRNAATGQTTIWYMSGPAWNGRYADVVPTVAGPEWSLAGVADFNRDGSPDLVWRDTSSGRTTIWYMTGAAWNGGYADLLPTVSGSDWKIVAIRDFNRDGYPDLLWRNSSTYRTTLWYMNGPAWNGNWGDLLPVVNDPGWMIVGK